MLVHKYICSELCRMSNMRATSKLFQAKLNTSLFSFWIYRHCFPLLFVNIHFLSLSWTWNKIKNFIIKILIYMIIYWWLIDLWNRSNFHILHINNMTFILLSNRIITYNHYFIIFYWKWLTWWKICRYF